MEVLKDEQYIAIGFLTDYKRLVMRYRSLSEKHMRFSFGSFSDSWQLLKFYQILNGRNLLHEQMEFLNEVWDTLKEIAENKMNKILNNHGDNKGTMPRARLAEPTSSLYWLVFEFSASIYTIEGLLINFSSRERVRPRFRMTFSFYEKISKLIELITQHDQREFYELITVITRLSNPIHTRFAEYDTPKILGQFEKPKGRLRAFFEEEVPQDMICAEDVKNSTENFSFNNDLISSSRRLSEFYEDIIARLNVINMEQRDSILIERNPSAINMMSSTLNYVQSISEKSLELDNYYKERELIYQENAEQEEIVLRPAPNPEIGLLEKPAENLFYFGAQFQIIREIRKLEDSMEAKERHERAKTHKTKKPRKSIKLRNYCAKRTKNDGACQTIATHSDDLLALSQSIDTPMINKQKRKIQVRTHVPQKPKIPRLEIPKNKKTVEEIMMAHLQPKLKITPLNKPKKIVLIDKALPNSAPIIRKKRRRLISKSVTAKKTKSDLEKVSKLNDHGSIFNQFGDSSVPFSELPLVEELPSPSTDKPWSNPRQKNPTFKSSQDKLASSVFLTEDYQADFEDSDEEIDSLLTPANTSPVFPIVTSSPDSRRSPDLKILDRPVSTDSGKESNESFEVRSRKSLSQAPSSPILALPAVSSREPSPLLETSSIGYIPSMVEPDQFKSQNLPQLFQLAESDDTEATDQESENDIAFVASYHKTDLYNPAEIIALDSDPEPIINSSSDVEIIMYEENKAMIDKIEIDAWLDAKRLPIGFSYQVGHKIKYAEIDDNETKYVSATIQEVSRKKRWRSGDFVMVTQQIEILTEGMIPKNVSIDAAEITHIFWDQLTDRIYSNNIFNIKQEPSIIGSISEPVRTPIRIPVIVVNPNHPSCDVMVLD